MLITPDFKEDSSCVSCHDLSDDPPDDIVAQYKHKII